jgi:outer membrane protein TolC
VRIDDQKAFDSLNAEIAAARADVDAATAAVQATIGAAPPTDPGPTNPEPTDPVQTARDATLDAVLAARDALQALVK